MSETPATDVVLSPPKVDGQTVHFSWSVSPETEMYRKTGFYLEFPDSVPLEQVPMRLWWTVFFLCIHSHWAVLRPCVIHLPVRLPPREKALWIRLLASYADTLDALNPGQPRPRNIKIIEQGERAPETKPLVNKGGCVAAFSGGKDSLAQTGLLVELGLKPLLVTTTSPMPNTYMHNSKYRARAMEEIQSRCGVQLIEVHSDLRSNWNNRVPGRWGYQAAMNEIADTHLFTAALVVSGYVHGATRMFLASENEVSRNVIADGVYLQHRHFMYSALTQAGISALLEPFGMKLGSLTTALHSDQVQTLVVQRYPHLSDLQCSCWLTTESAKACSECGECRRLAWVSLARGGSPARQGVDLVKMLLSCTRPAPERSRLKKHPPNALSSESFKRQLGYAILSIPPAVIRLYISSNYSEALPRSAVELAMLEFTKLQADFRSEFPIPPEISRYRAGFLMLLDEDLRDKLVRIFDDHFQAEIPGIYTEELGNLCQAIEWLTQPDSNIDENRNKAEISTKYINRPGI